MSHKMVGPNRATGFPDMSLAPCTAVVFRIVPSLALLLFVTPVAFAQPPFLQDSFPDGVITIEAEHAHRSTTNSAAAWVRVDNGVYSGGAAMQALPDDGVNNNTGYALNSPALEYDVLFLQTGVHYVAVRGSQLDGSSDTCHVGLNGIESSTSDRIGSFGSSPEWLNRTTFDAGQPLSYIDVPVTGVHTVTVWMREDGFIIDKLVLSTNAAFLPYALGPPESPRAGEINEEAAAVSDVDFAALSLVNGQLIAEVRPAYGAASFDFQSAADGGMPTQVVAGGVQALSAVLPATGEVAMISVRATPMDPGDRLAVSALNRLAYGPTPADLDAVLPGRGGIGADAWMSAQLAPEAITETADDDPVIRDLAHRLASGDGRLTDLRAWFQLRSLYADRQWVEVMLQFLDNHFVTSLYESRNWLDSHADLTRTEAEMAAANLEYREVERWRSVLLDPNGTFHDLLRISCESPAMILYLDTVISEPDSPNENFSREILELFTMGVDNGYQQSDIEAMSPAWTGWRVARVHPEDVDDPFASAYASDIIHAARESSDWMYLRGTNDPPADWMQPSFIPGGDWVTGVQAPIGFGNAAILTELADMRNNYSTVYLRRPMVIPPGTDLSDAVVRIFLDDGCVIWFNGIEAARRNVPDGPLVHDSRASSSISMGWLTLTNRAEDVFTEGTNWIAVHLLNSYVGNSDVGFDLEVTVPGAFSFVFDPASHATGEKILFSNRVVNARFGSLGGGQSYELTLPARTGTNGIADGYDIAAHLANLPQTREFICTKLCRVFVHDDFGIGDYFNLSDRSDDAELLAACMTAWDTPAADGRRGNIRAVMNAIVGSDLFRSPAAYANKVKTPVEYVSSAMRILSQELGDGSRTASTDGYDLHAPIDRMGMDLFTRSDPDGYPEVGNRWIDSSTLAERLAFIENLLMQGADTLKDQAYGGGGDDNLADPVALLQLRLDPGDWTDAQAVAGLFLDLFFPAEGAANLDYDAGIALDILNADESGVPGSSPFATLSPGTDAYDLRIRSLVAALLSHPRF